jgi:hypothetical protein
MEEHIKKQSSQITVTEDGMQIDDGDQPSSLAVRRLAAQQTQFGLKETSAIQLRLRS